MSNSSIFQRKGFLLGAAVFFVAFALRLVGIRWGLPNDLHIFSYHPDEGINLSYASQIDPGSLKFTPHFYNYPTLYLTLLRLLGGAAPKDPAEFSGWLAAGHLAGRFLNVLAGSSLAVAGFVATRRFSKSDLGGVIAGLSLAFAPALVVHSDFQTVDMLATAFFAWSVERSLALSELTAEDLARFGLRTTIWAAVFAGLSMGTKYNGVICLASLFAALALVKGKRALGWAGGSVLVCGLVFVLTTPGVILESAKFLEDFKFELRYAKEGHGDVFALTVNGFLYHFSNLVLGMGSLLTAVGLAAGLYALTKRHKWAWILMASWLVYFLAIGSGQDKYIRYALPLFFGIACWIGYAVASGQRKGKIGHVVAVFGILGLGGLDGGGLFGASKFLSVMGQPDARDEAAKMLRKDYKGKRVGFVSDPWDYSPPVYPVTGRFRGPYNTYLADMSNSDPIVVRHVPDNPDARIDWDPKLLEVEKPDAVVFSNIEQERYTRWLRIGDQAPEKYKLMGQNYDEFMKRLSSEYELQAIFGDVTRQNMVHDLQYVWPVIQVWKRKGS